MERGMGLTRAAIIMAGGRGERFWPLSREHLPKQFLRLAGAGTMLQETMARVRSLVSPAATYVVTGARFAGLVREQVEIPNANIILEPQGRDTAGCIGLATAVVRQRFPDEDPVMVVLPADHLVTGTEAFVAAVETAIAWAQQHEALVTIGVPPTRPETGYGYIKYSPGSALAPLGGGADQGVYHVEKFTEKPDYHTALQFLREGHYLWNSGMFVWRASVIWEAMARYLPEVYQGLEEIAATVDTPSFAGVVDRVFPTLEKISVDLGIMEKADNAYVVPGKFGWDDVGVWSALSRVYQADANNNIVAGTGGSGPVGEDGVPVVFLDSSECIVYRNQERLLAAVGVSDLIIVDTDDVLLVCNKHQEQELKQLLAMIQAQGLEKYL